MIKIAPSVLAADILHLQGDVKRLLDAGADLLHLDIMDAHFVPNLSFGPSLVAGLRRGFPDSFLDVHLMMSNPEDYLEAFRKAGASAITVHVEIGAAAEDCLKAIRGFGLMAGLSLKPGTPVEALKPLLPLCDLVLIMSVEPGFGGQKMMPETLPKGRELREMGFEGRIAVDGGITADNAQQAIAQGIDCLVMGTGLFKAEDPAAEIARVRALSGGKA